MRALTDPLIEYLRCQLKVSCMNVDQAGEDIRWVDAANANDLGMPDYDYYLVDNAAVARLIFIGDGQLGGVRLCRDEEVLQQRRRWRDVTWPHAIPHQEYVAR